MRWIRTNLIVASGIALAGCSDSTGPVGDNALQVNVEVINAPSATASGDLAPQAGAATSVEVESATFVLGGLKLETAGVDSTVDWIFEESVVLPLDLTGEPILAFDVNVTPGTYKELEVSVDKLEVGNPEEEPLIDQWPGLADVSVMVTGMVTRDGGTPEAFTFTAAIDVDLELAFDTPVEFTEEDNPVALFSLTIDLGSWFIDNGDMLDPTDAANRSVIEGNIEASLDVHEDE